MVERMVERGTRNHREGTPPYFRKKNTKHTTQTSHTACPHSPASIPGIANNANNPNSPRYFSFFIFLCLCFVDFLLFSWRQRYRFSFFKSILLLTSAFSQKSKNKARLLANSKHCTFTSGCPDGNLGACLSEESPTKAGV